VAAISIIRTTEVSPARGAALLRLCQLVSPALPVGAFNFSQGLEYAVEAGWIRDEKSAFEWISGIMRHAIGTLDVPILLNLHDAWGRSDMPSVTRWSRRLIAARETAELRLEDRHMGTALAKILAELGMDEAGAWISNPDAAFATLFALAASRWGIGADEAAWGYLWAWTENQVLGAVKLIPLGQTAGQRLIDRLIGGIPSAVEHARGLADDDIGVAAPMQGIASARHETQYTRLFKS
jgi:urease accessory protein